MLLGLFIMNDTWEDNRLPAAEFLFLVLEARKTNYLNIQVNY